MSLKCLLLNVFIFGALYFVPFSITVNNSSAFPNINNNNFKSCENPAYFMWNMTSAFTRVMGKKILPENGFNINCSVDEVPQEQEFTHDRFLCLKYGGTYSEYCHGGRLFFAANNELSEMYQLNMLQKQPLNKILTQYCNKYHSNPDDNVCNFKLLSFDMEDPQQRVEFLSNHIDCANNKSQNNKTWVFKEAKHQGSGVHFYNNHQLIYKLISPKFSEQDRTCPINIQPFKTPSYFRKEGFTYNKIKNGRIYGFRVQTKGLLMQEFISNPLLIENKVFHVRSFLLIPSYSKPFIALHYPEGTLFRNTQEFDNTSKQLNKNALRSNGHVSKLSSNVDENGTYFKKVWGYNRFQNYLNEIYGDALFNYTNNKLQNDIKHIAKQVFTANVYNNELNKRKINETKRKNDLLFNNNIDMKFHIFCMDIVVNNKFELKLLEMNFWCGQYCIDACKSKRDKNGICVLDYQMDNAGEEWMCDAFIKETSDILFEVYQKRFFKHPIKTIDSLKKFQIVFWNND